MPPQGLDQGTPALFRPVVVGNMRLAHRVVHCPLTRLRATKEHVPTDLMASYYAQRARVPGTFFVSEAAVIAPAAGTMEHAPGIWNAEQAAAWKKVSTLASECAPPALRNRHRLWMSCTRTDATSSCNCGLLDAPRARPSSMLRILRTNTLRRQRSGSARPHDVPRALTVDG